MMKILLIERDTDLREVLCEQLSNTNRFELFKSSNVPETSKLLSYQTFDLIVVDLHPSGPVSLELSGLIRETGLECPVLVITNENDVPAHVFGSDKRISDYIKKPFKFTDLLSRIDFLFQKPDDPKLFIGPYTFQPAMKLLLTESKEEIRLTEKETSMLLFLCHSKDYVVQRDTLLHEVWGYSADITTHTLETHVYRLRQKMKSGPGDTDLLVTEAGGYRLAI
ncbi:MAG: response regulator transcription factor [Planktomarina sp.]|nr:response regulator transcription factor [Planktomarina sp.]